MIKNMCAGLVERWRRQNLYAYLSQYEARLNRSLWILLWVALGYSALQHVLLADRPAFSEWAFRAGEVVYDLSIAYAGAFIFYLLVVRLPLRRDRRNVYRHMAFTLRGPHDRAVDLVRHLNVAAGFVGEFEAGERKITREHITELCGRLTPNTTAPFHLAGGRLELTVLDLMRHEIGLIRMANEEILASTTFLSTDAIDYVSAIEDCSFLRYPEQIFPYIDQGLIEADASMTWIADELFTYLRLVHRFDRWRIQFAPVRPQPQQPDNDEEELLSDD